MLSPTFFLNGVLGLIRIGKDARKAYKESVLSRETLVHFAPSFGDAVFTAQDSRMWAKALIQADRSSALFHEFYEIVGARIDPIVDDDDPRWDRAIEQVMQQNGLYAPTQVPEGGFPAAINSPVIVLTHHDWFKDENAPWARFGLTIADVALDFLSQEPEMLGPKGLGLNQDVRRVAGALLPNLANALRPELYVPGEKKVGEMLGEALFQAALETVVEDPSLVTSQEHWQPIVEAAVGSVNTQVQSTLSSGGKLFARDRMTAFVQGPFVHAIIGAVENNADALLKGSFKETKFLGQVSRNLLGHLSELTPGDKELREFFSPRGAALIFDTALETLSERPDLLIRGNGDEVELSRRFLSSVADIVKSDTKPFGDKDFATDIGLIVLEIGRDYAISQVLANPEDKDWDLVMSDLAQHLIGEIFDGFSEIVKPTVPGQPPRDVFKDIFSKSQAVSLIKLIANHVAATPGLLIGDTRSQEVKNIARGVAQFIAADENNLLTGDQWRGVVGVALDLSAKNPGALFGLEENGNQARSIAVELIGDLLTVAGEQFDQGGPIRGPGQILIGDTLKRTVEATLQAASSMTAKLLDAQPGSETHTAIQDFARRLLRLSKGDDGGFSLSAAEWVEIYRGFIAEVMEKGMAVLDESSAEYIQDGDLLAILYELSPAPRETETE